MYNCSLNCKCYSCFIYRIKSYTVGQTTRVQITTGLRLTYSQHFRCKCFRIHIFIFLYRIKTRFLIYVYYNILPYFCQLIEGREECSTEELKEIKEGEQRSGMGDIRKDIPRLFGEMMTQLRNGLLSSLSCYSWHRILPLLNVSALLYILLQHGQ